MDNILVKPSFDSRRELKAAPFMRREYYTQIHCLPSSCVPSGDQNEIRDDMRQYNAAIKNTSQVLMDQYVWRTSTNLPGNLYRVEREQSVRKKGSGLQPHLSLTTPELEHQVPSRDQGILHTPQHAPAKQLPFGQSVHRQSVDDSVKRVASPHPSCPSHFGRQGKTPGRT